MARLNGGGHVGGAHAEGERTRVVAMVCEGLYQRYLLSRLGAEFQLAGIVSYAPRNARGGLTSRVARYLNPRSAARHIRARIAMRGYAAKARPLVESLFFVAGRPPELPRDIPLARVENVNATEAAEFVERLRPDIVCVNGTNLLREPMLALMPRIRHGIINLHTGLSPYTRGGNCDLFTLLEGRPEMVGITIHHIDRGIDSGDIIITARPELDEGDNFEMVEARSFRLGIDMMLVATRQLIEGRAERVRQWEPGKLFLRRTGYVYEPYHRVRVNRMLRSGLIADYLSNRAERDSAIRLIGRRH